MEDMVNNHTNILINLYADGIVNTDAIKSLVKNVRGDVISALKNLRWQNYHIDASWNVIMTTLKGTIEERTGKYKDHAWWNNIWLEFLLEWRMKKYNSYQAYKDENFHTVGNWGAVHEYITDEKRAWYSMSYKTQQEKKGKTVKSIEDFKKYYK